MGAVDLLSTMEKVLDRAGTVVDGVEPSQLGNQTPCTEWTVRDVINHVVGGATMFAECVEQGSVRAAFSSEGALEKTVKLPFGEMPAGVALNIAVMDVMTHSLDIAKATGQTVDDEELLETALTIGRQLITADFRSPGIFDAEQPAPPDASPADRLLAFAGRRV